MATELVTTSLSRKRLLQRAAIGGTALAAAGASSVATAAPTRVGAKKKAHYVYVSFLSTISYWNGPKAGLRAAANEFGITYDFVGPTEYDVGKQIDALNTVIAQRPSGIIVLPIQFGALDKSIKKAMDQGIPVITHEQGPVGPYELGYLGFDRAEAGAKGARILAKAIEGKGGKVAALIYNAAVSDMQRGLKGFKDELRKLRPDLKVVVGVDKADPEYGTTLCSQLIQAHPDLKGFMSIDTSGGPSAARAVKAAGKKLPVIAGGLNEQNTEVWPLIANGQILAGIGGSAATEVYMAVGILNALNKNAIGEVDWHKHRDLSFWPRNTMVNTYVVTKKNVSALAAAK